jgi:hypothetical protein
MAVSAVGSDYQFKRFPPLAVVIAGQLDGGGPFAIDTGFGQHVGNFLVKCAGLAESQQFRHYRFNSIQARKGVCKPANNFLYLVFFHCSELRYC